MAASYDMEAELDAKAGVEFIPTHRIGQETANSTVAIIH
jgi:hypothetical protein